MTSNRLRGAVLVVALVALLLTIGRLALDEFGALEPKVPGATAGAPVVVNRTPLRRPRTEPLQDPSSAISPGEVGSEILGTCVDESGRPVAGARVFVLAAGEMTLDPADIHAAPRATMSDDRGHFRLSVSKQGAAVLDRVVARHDSYQPAQSLLTSATESITLVLRSGLAINGVVVTKRNQPVQGARLVARGRRANGKSLQAETLSDVSVQIQDAYTDAAGAFTLNGLVDQSYVLELQAPGLRRVEPGAWFGAMTAKPGESVRIVVETAGVVHARLIDDVSGEAISHGMLDFHRDSLRAVQFWPRSNPGAPSGLPFLAGPAGSEICMLGASQESLPGQCADIVVIGTSASLISDGQSTVTTTVSAPGYQSKTLELPLRPLGCPYDVSAAVVQLSRANGEFGVVDLRIRNQDGTPLRDRWVHVEYARLGTTRRPKDSALQSRKVVKAMGLALGPTMPDAEKQARADAETAIAKWLEDHAGEPLTARCIVDADGVARLGKLPPGEYSLVPGRGLSATSFVVQSAGNHVVEATCEAPSPGSRLHTRLGLVRLKIVDASGAPVPGMGLQLEGADGAVPLDDREMQVAGYGQELIAPGSTIGTKPFELTLPRGDWIAKLYRPGYRDAAVRFTVRGNGAIEDVLARIVTE